MTTRNMTYQFEWGFMTIDTRTEEEPEGYIAKFPTTIEEREDIESGEAILTVVDDELIITREEI